MFNETNLTGRLKTRQFKRLGSFIRSLYHGKGQAFLLSVILAVVFFTLAVLQHWFVFEQVNLTVSRELAGFAAQISKELAYRDHWDLAGYRRSAPSVPDWIVVTTDGLIIDLEPFRSGIFNKVEPFGSIDNNKLQTIISPIGETWRLLVKKVFGGTVILGIVSPENMREADAKLLASAKIFGDSLDKAKLIGPRDTPTDVDFVVLNSVGRLIDGWGGVPLRIDPKSVPSAQISHFIENGDPWLLYVSPVLDDHGVQVASILIPKDIRLAQKSIRTQDRFNGVVIGLALLLTLSLGVFLLAPMLSKSTKEVTLDEALKSGESLTVEFKSTFHWCVFRKQPHEDRYLDILRSIAGFLNSQGGTLFLGVEEIGTQPAVRGLPEDIRLAEESKGFGSSRDKLQRTLRDLIATRIGHEYSRLVKDHFVEAGKNTCWIIYVEPSYAPVYVLWKDQKKFFVREGPRTSDLDLESCVRYIKSKWG